MSWQWPGQATGATGHPNWSATSATTTPGTTYTAEQWATMNAMQQQNWQQWINWQQQYQQWQQQYGEQYAKQMALTGQSAQMPFMPTVPTIPTVTPVQPVSTVPIVTQIQPIQPPLPVDVKVAPPLPKAQETKPPLPPDEEPRSLPDFNASVPPPSTKQNQGYTQNMYGRQNTQQNYQGQGLQNYRSPGTNTQGPRVQTPQNRIGPSSSGTRVGDESGNFGVGNRFNTNQPPPSLLDMSIKSPFGKNTRIQSFPENKSDFGKRSGDFKDNFDNSKKNRWESESNFEDVEKPWNQENYQQSGNKNELQNKWQKSNQQKNWNQDFPKSGNQSKLWNNPNNDSFSQSVNKDLNKSWGQTAPKNQSWTSNINTSKPASTRPNSEELSEAEKLFDKQFEQWEAQFNKWKDQNQNHPDKQQYKEYEAKWESWRTQLLDRREQMRKKRLGLSASSTSITTAVTSVKTSVFDSSPLTNLHSPNQTLDNQQKEHKEPLLPTPSMIVETELAANLKDDQKSPQEDIDISFLFSQPPKEQRKNIRSRRSSVKLEDPAAIENLPTDISFLKSANTSDGIPGLDLVKRQDNAAEKDKDDENKSSPDFEAISKGINSILGDSKLLTMLSLVSQNKNPTTGVVTPQTQTLTVQSSCNPVISDIVNNSYHQLSETYNNQNYSDKQFDDTYPADRFHEQSNDSREFTRHFKPSQGDSFHDNRERQEENFTNLDDFRAQQNFDRGGNSNQEPQNKNSGEFFPQHRENLVNRGPNINFNQPFNCESNNFNDFLNSSGNNFEISTDNFTVPPPNNLQRPPPNNFQGSPPNKFHVPPPNRSNDFNRNGSNQENKQFNQEQQNDFGRTNFEFIRGSNWGLNNRGNFNDSSNRGSNDFNQQNRTSASMPPRSPMDSSRSLMVGLRSSDGSRGFIDSLRGSDGSRGLMDTSRSLNSPKSFNEGSRRQDISRGLMDNPRSLLESPRSLLDGSRSLLDGPRSLLDGSRNLLDSSRGLLDGSRNLLSRGFMNTLRGPLDSSRTSIERARDTLHSDRGTINDSRDPVDGPRGSKDNTKGSVDSIKGSADSIKDSLDGPRCFMDGPTGSSDGTRGLMDSSRGFNDRQRGLMDSSRSFDNQRGQKNNRGPYNRDLNNASRGFGDRGFMDGPRSFLDSPRSNIDSLRGPFDNLKVPMDSVRGLDCPRDGPRGFMDGPRNLMESSRGLLDTPRGQVDGPRGLMNVPIDLMNASRDSNDDLRGPMNISRDSNDDRRATTINNRFNKAQNNRSAWLQNESSRDNFNQTPIGFNNQLQQKNQNDDVQFRGSSSQNRNTQDFDEFRSKSGQFRNRVNERNYRGGDMFRGDFRDNNTSAPTRDSSEKYWDEALILKPFSVIDYGHKSVNKTESTFMEPVQTFDYNHASKNVDKPQNKIENDYSRGDNTRGDNFRRDDSRETSFNKFNRYSNSPSRLQNDPSRFYEPPRPPRINFEKNSFNKNKSFDRSQHDDDRDSPVYNKDTCRFETKQSERNYDKYDNQLNKNSISSKKFDSNIEYDEIEDEDPFADDDVSESVRNREQNVEKFMNQSNPNQDLTDNKKKTTVTMVEDLLTSPARNSRPQRIVIILRGPPGSGKTFLAKLIKDKEVEQGGSAPRILSLDDYFMTETDKEIIEKETGRKTTVKEMIYEYEECMELPYRQSLERAFKKTITDGFFPFIILDCVNDKVKHFSEMWSFAKQNGFQVYVCQMELDATACTKRNIHHRSEIEIEKLVSGWEDTPSHYLTLDATSMIQAGCISEVEMEEVTTVSDDEDNDGEFEGHIISKWEQMEPSGEKLAKLDGTNKPLRPKTMEDYLQMDDEIPEERPGIKRVRWADLEERRHQEKIRALGFVVGQTDWNRMLDPTQGSSALTQTKYIERVRRF